MLVCPCFPRTPQHSSLFFLCRCVCCTVRGDLIRILGRLIRRKTRFDAILIETTGLADPAPVAQTFFVDEEMKEELCLDAILTIVDARHALQHLKEKKPPGVENEAVEQASIMLFEMLHQKRSPSFLLQRKKNPNTLVSALALPIGAGGVC